MDGPIDLKSPDAEAKLAKSTKPLVVLLDGKHFDVEWGILKDVATCAHINAKSLDEIPDKVCVNWGGGTDKHSVVDMRDQSFSKKQAVNFKFKKNLGRGKSTTKQDFCVVCNQCYP